MLPGLDASLSEPPKKGASTSMQRRRKLTRQRNSLNNVSNNIDFKGRMGGNENGVQKNTIACVDLEFYIN